MKDIDKARKLFHEAGLAFPKIPHEFALRLKERGDWVFATREIEESPYDLDHYVDEVARGRVDDYVVLAHAGHGVNSYAIQYYLVQGALAMFLHLRWGGVYSDAEADAAEIRDCFSLADETVLAARVTERLRPGDQLKVVAASFYGSYWLPPGRRRQRNRGGNHKRPADVLAEVLRWLTDERL